ncbi:unnamed protein product [Camellia sinensis]
MVMPCLFSIKDKSNKAILYRGSSSHGLYHLPAVLPRFSSHPVCLNTTTASSTWHASLGHPSLHKMKLICNKLKLPQTVSSSSFPCKHCCMAKSHRLPFSLSTTSINKPLALIHSDVWGPFHSASSIKYYVLFVDDFSKFTWLYPLHFKSEVFTKFIEFKAFVENQFTVKLQILRTDNGTEYLGLKFQEFLRTHGIDHQLSCPYTPPQNGVAERKHRHIIETTIALLQQSGVPLAYWFDTVATAVYLINRMPSSKLHNQSPFEMLFHQLPDYHFLKPFGCLCFPWLKPYAHHKLQPRSIACVFLGYIPSVKGYRCLDSSTGHIYVSRHVVFHENTFPFLDSSSQVPSSSLSQYKSFFWPSCSHSTSAIPSPPPSATPAPVLSPISLSTAPAAAPVSSTSPLPGSSPLSSSSSPAIPIDSLVVDLQSYSLPSSPIAPSLNIHPMVTRSKAAHPILSAITSTASTDSEPSSYKEAALSSAWIKAMNE